MQSVLEILNKCEEYFAAKGIPTPKIDAQLLLARSLGCKRLELFLRFEQPLDEKILAPFRELVKRRAKREPLQHILGDTDFFGLKLKCDRRALIPRQETEELCEIATSKIFTDPNAPLKILDLGTGSGAIALALSSHFKNSQTIAVDFSDDALALANENLNFVKSQNPLLENIDSRVQFIKSDWFSNVSGTFDLIVANPPYLTDAEFQIAQDEVKFFDPLSALVSKEQGIADLKKILDASPSFLNQGGCLLCECGLTHPPLLAQLASQTFSSTQIFNDVSRRPRFILCQK